MSATPSAIAMRASLDWLSAQRVPRTGRSKSSAIARQSRGASGLREEDPEGAARVELRLDLEPAAVTGDDPAHDGQPQARPRLRDGLRVGGAEELGPELGDV